MDEIITKLKENDKEFNVLDLKLDKKCKLKDLTKALKENEIVDEVRVSECDESFHKEFSTDDIQSLFKALGHLKNLKYLAFGHVVESGGPVKEVEVSVQALTSVLDKVGKNLLWLYIRSANLVVHHDKKEDKDKKTSEKLYEDFCKSLSGLKSLTRLSLMCNLSEDLASCDIDPIISKGLKEHKTLEKLLLGVNQYNQKGGTIEAKSFKSLYDIKTLENVRLLNVEVIFQHPKDDDDKDKKDKKKDKEKKDDKKEHKEKKDDKKDKKDKKEKK